MENIKNMTFVAMEDIKQYSYIEQWKASWGKGWMEDIKK